MRQSKLPQDTLSRANRRKIGLAISGSILTMLFCTAAFACPQGQKRVCELDDRGHPHCHCEPDIDPGPPPKSPWSGQTISLSATDWQTGGSALISGDGWRPNDSVSIFIKWNCNFGTSGGPRGGPEFYGTFPVDNTGHFDAVNTNTVFGTGVRATTYDSDAEWFCTDWSAPVEFDVVSQSTTATATASTSVGWDH